MRVIILGGTGFIGQHFANLCRSSAVVVVVSRHLPRSVDRLAEVTYIQGDCASPDFLKQVIRPADYVVFLAYNSVPKTSFDDPLLDMQENLPLAINLLTVLREVPIKRLLYVSSGGTVYGHAKVERPISEDHATNPISPYGITKLSIEKYCHMYCRIFGVPVVIARPSNPFGPWQIPYRGQGFVATAVAKILLREEITIFGEHGTVRDYLYIDDLVSAMALLLRADVAVGSLYNIGSSVGMNNVEVLTSIADVMGLAFSDLHINYLPVRHFDATYNVLTNHKLKELGWHPSVDFREGLSRTVEWQAAGMNKV